MDKLLNKVQNQQNLQSLLMSFELLENATTMQNHSSGLGLQMQAQSAQTFREPNQFLQKQLQRQRQGEKPAEADNILQKDGNGYNQSGVAEINELQGISERSFQSSLSERERQRRHQGEDMSSWLGNENTDKYFDVEDGLIKESKMLGELSKINNQQQSSVSDSQNQNNEGKVEKDLQEKVQNSNEEGEIRGEGADAFPGTVPSQEISNEVVVPLTNPQFNPSKNNTQEKQMEKEETFPDMQPLSLKLPTGAKMRNTLKVSKKRQSNKEIENKQLSAHKLQVGKDMPLTTNQSISNTSQHVKPKVMFQLSQKEVIDINQFKSDTSSNQTQSNKKNGPASLSKHRLSQISQGSHFFQNQGGLNDMLRQKLINSRLLKQTRRNSIDMYQSIKSIPVGMMPVSEAILTLDFKKELQKRGISLNQLQQFQEREMTRKSTFYQQKKQKQRPVVLKQEQQLQLQDLKQVIIKMMEQEEDRRKIEEQVQQQMQSQQAITCASVPQSHHPLCIQLQPPGPILGDSNIDLDHLLSSGFFLDKANQLEIQQLKQSRKKALTTYLANAICEHNPPNPLITDRPITPQSQITAQSPHEKQADLNSTNLVQSQSAQKILSPEKLTQKKMLVTKKINEMVERNKQKEEQLRQLREQLQMQKDIYQCVQKNVTSPKYKESEKKKNQQLLSPEQVYRQKPYQTLIDLKEVSRPLNITDLDSIMEIKAHLEGKVALVEQRQALMDSRAEVFRKMIKTINDDLIHDLKKQQQIETMIQNVSTQLLGLNHINRIDTDRTLEIENIQIELNQKISKNRVDMDNVLSEKQITLQNYEQDSQQTLIKLLQVIERIKELRKSLQDIQTFKQNFKVKQAEIIEEFLKQKNQIKFINRLQQLNLIKCFQQKIDMIEKEHDNNDDEMRLAGLQQIQQLKVELEETHSARTLLTSSPTTKNVQGNTSLLESNSPGKPEKQGLSSCVPSQGQGGKGESHQVSAIVSRSQSNYQSPKRSPQVDSIHSAQSQQMMNSSGSQKNGSGLSYELEQYILNQKKYDNFYQQRHASVGQLDLNLIINRYCMSTIKLNSLHNAHKQRQIEKQEKQKEIEKVQEKISELETEYKGLGSYLEKLDDYFRLHRKDHADIIVQQDEDNPKVFVTTVDCSNDIQQEQFLAKSIEALKDMRLVQQLKTTQVFKQIVNKKDMIREYFSQLDLMLCVYYGQLQQVKKQTTITFEGNNSSSATFLEILKRYADRASPAKKGQLARQRTGAHRRNSNRKRNASFKQSSENTRSDVGGLTEKSQQIRDHSSEDPLTVPSVTEQVSNSQRSIEATGLQQMQQVSSRTTSSNCFIDNPQFVQKAQKAIQDDIQKYEEQEKQIVVDLKSLINHLQSIQMESKSQIVRKMQTMGRGMQFQKIQDLQGIGGDEQQQLDIEDFDPVYRKQDFIQIRRNVINSLDLKRKTKQEILRMKQNPKKWMAPAKDIQDSEQLEFLACDPRKKAQETEEGKKQQLLQAKLIENQKFKGRDSLWKTTQGEHEKLRIELFKQKQQISGLQRQEQEFIDDLKLKINARYNLIKNDFKSNQNSVGDLQLGCHSQKQISGQTSQKFQGYNTVAGTDDFETVKKSYSISNLHTAQRSRKNNAWSICSEKNATLSSNKDKVNYESGDFKPLTSPCFDMQVKRPLQTASLKERIKLNKLLTTSQKTGKLIGVNAERPNKIKGFDNLDYDQSHLNVLFSNRDTLNSGGNLQQRVDKYRSHLLTTRSSTKPYTTNSAFNVTYQTVKFSDNLRLRNIARAKEANAQQRNLDSVSAGGYHTLTAGASTHQSGLDSHNATSGQKMQSQVNDLQQFFPDDTVIKVKHVETFNKFFNRNKKKDLVFSPISDTLKPQPSTPYHLAQMKLQLANGTSGPNLKNENGSFKQRRR